jgi:diguanylate cyclase (GGDEF)-like protein
MEQILIVTSNSEIRSTLQVHLTQAGYGISEAENGKIAIEKIKSDLPDVVLLDDMLSDTTGFQVCQRLLSIPQSDLVYVVMLTTIAGIEYKIKGLDRGADEYVTKPFEVEDLLNRIREGLRRLRKKKNAVIDPLTKLYNKYFFSTHLAQEAFKTQRYQHHLSLIMGNIDDFKHVNNTYGHSASDAVLVEIGKLLRKNCRQSDILACWGGEEFAMLLPETDLMGGMVLAERIRQVIESHQFKDVDYLTASFGVATLTTDRQELIDRANLGLHEAKEKGMNRVISTDK